MSPGFGYGKLELIWLLNFCILDLGLHFGFRNLELEFIIIDFSLIFRIWDFELLFWILHFGYVILLFGF